MDTSNAFDLRLPAEMAKVAEQAGLYKVSKKKELSFFLAVTAGVFISIAFVFYITVTTGPAPATALAKLAGGVCFSLGLILVVVCGADLFTSTVLTVMAKASGLISWRQLIINWIIVYLGNLVGALFPSHDNFFSFTSSSANSYFATFFLFHFWLFLYFFLFHFLKV